MVPSILSRLTNVRKAGSGWTARCPAHDDQRSSLSVSVGDDGKTLVHCHAGCDPAAVVSAVGLAMRDLASPNGNGQHSTNKPEILKAYNYVDEQGTLLYQVVRFMPKDFQQRRPKPGGGWEWKLGTVRRVPYRLPELISADPGEWVFVPEGEKDVDRLRDQGLVATTNCGGAGKWRPEYNEYLRGRRVAILPDNDQSGRDHAAQVAAGLRGIAAEVRVVELPGLPPKGDVSDWLDAGGTVEDLRRLVDQAPAAGFGYGDKPKKAPPQPWVPFPIRVLPEPVRSYVEGSSAAIGCDPALVGTAILPALAGAVGNSRVVLLKAGWTEPAVLWGCVVGDSGCQKSPALDAGTRHVKRRQAAAIEAYQAERDEYDKAVETYKLDLDDWKRTKRKNGAVQPEAPAPPVCKRSYVSDITVEGLALILAENDRGVLDVRDELSGWVNSFGEYKHGPGSDVANWLNIHGGRDLVVDRKTGDRKTLYVRRAAVSITGGIQPGTLRRVLGREHFENGLVARLLWAFPPRRRKRWTETGIDQDLDQRVEAVFDWLYGLEPEIRDGHPEPVVVGLSQDGKAAWVEFYNRHAERIADASGDEAAVLSKIEAAAARLALVLHLVRQAGDPDAGDAVDDQDIQAGVSLAEWYANEAFRVYQLFGETDEDRDRRRVVEFIQRHGGTITANDLRRRSRQFATSEAAETFLNGLVKAGIGTWHGTEHGETGGRPTRTFRLVSVVSVSETTPDARKTEVSDTDTGDTGDNSTDQDQPAADEPEPEGYEPEYCRVCRRMLIDRTATVVWEYSGDFCRECIEAGRVRVGGTTKLRTWDGSRYPVGTSLADDPEPAVEEPVCNHHDPESFVHRDGKAYCRVCNKYMGRLRT